MKLIRADYIFLIAMVLMLGSHSVTQYLVAKYTSAEQIADSGEKILVAAEMNPLAVFLLQFEKMKYLYSYLLAPAFMGAIYYYCRRKFITINPDILEALSVMLFLMYMINFFNDASYMLGFVVRNGGF